MLNVTWRQGNANQTMKRYELTLVRVAETNNGGDSRCRRACRERGARALLVGCNLAQLLQRTVWRFLPKNLKMELPSDAALALMGMHQKNSETVIKKQMRLRV